MSRKHLKVPRDDADRKIDSQINKGIDLVKEGDDINALKSDRYTRNLSKDSFIVKYEHWVSFTCEVLDEIFVSSVYSHDFDKHESSHSELVDSSWTPDVNYYIGHYIIPKLEYLKILKNNLSEFELPKEQSTAKPNQKENAPLPDLSSVTQKKPNIDISKITLVELIRSLTLAQWAGLIGGLFTIVSFAFLIGFNLQQWKLEKENRDLYFQVNKLTVELNTLRNKPDTSNYGINRMVIDSLKRK